MRSDLIRNHKTNKRIRPVLRRRDGRAYRTMSALTSDDDDVTIGPGRLDGQDLILARFKAVIPFWPSSPPNVLLMGSSVAVRLASVMLERGYYVNTFDPVENALYRVTPSCTGQPPTFTLVEDWSIGVRQFNLLLSGCDRLSPTGDMVTPQRNAVRRMGKLLKWKKIGCKTIVVALVSQPAFPHLKGHAFLQADVAFWPDRERVFTTVYGSLGQALMFRPLENEMVCRHVVKALQACGSDQQLYTVINQQPNSLAPAHGIGPTPDYRAVYESLIAAVHACGGDRVVMNHIWKASRYALGRALTYQPGAWIGGVDRTNATDLPTRAGAARTTWKEVRCRTRLE